MHREVSGMMFSYINKSQYHESCIPAHQRAPPHLEPNTKPIAVLDYTTCDAVKENKIWRQCVNNEANGVKKWEEKWSFLLEYDEKGNRVTRTPLPKHESRFSSGPVPTTGSGIYGSRSGTEHTQTMQRLENALAAGNRRRKLDNELVLSY